MMEWGSHWKIGFYNLKKTAIMQKSERLLRLGGSVEYTDSTKGCTPAKLNLSLVCGANVSNHWYKQCAWCWRSGDPKVEGKWSHAKRAAGATPRLPQRDASPLLQPGRIISSAWAVCTSPRPDVCSLTWFFSTTNHTKERVASHRVSFRARSTGTLSCLTMLQRTEWVHQWQLLAMKHRSIMVWVLKKGWRAFVCVREECVMRLRRPLQESPEACLSNEMDVQWTVSAPFCLCNYPLCGRLIIATAVCVCV